jgi:hypothetical protein
MLLMATTSDQFSTDCLTPEQLREAMVALPAVLMHLLGDCVVTARYEYGCNIHPDLMYQPMAVGSSFMMHLIQNSLDQRIVEPGDSDIRFELPEGRLDLLFCHEGDIHLNGTDDSLLDRFMKAAPFDQFTWHSWKQVDKKQISSDGS